MHTDEYEISIAREIIVCRRFTAKLRKRLEERAGRFGVSDPDQIEAAQGLQTKKPSRKELKQWREDIEALAIWAQRLREYEDALRMMRTSAPS